MDLGYHIKEVIPNFKSPMLLQPTPKHASPKQLFKVSQTKENSLTHS